ncbi:MAG: glutathione S-transferase family protein [Alphaproteobacteria bacterium]|nr:glutathione S-transferase family protein [Alphaproteobacteria bacterium]
MIDLYTWGTPNGRKVSIMLEECALPYRVHAVNIGKGEQFKPEFLAISPNNRIPAIVDGEGPGGKPLSVFESGAILIYLAEKSGKFLPADPARRSDTLQWLMWQMGGFGPMLGQAHHFLRAAKEKIEYGINRYVEESKRLYGVLDGQLAKTPYVAGADYTIADMAIFPWAARHEWHTVDLAAYPHVKRWFEQVGARAAVKKGMEVPFLN